MKKEDLYKYICVDSAAIVDVMKAIDKNSAGLVYVENSKGELCGCLTDGDIRRWIIRNGSINSTAGEVMNRDPKYVFLSDIENGVKKMLEEQVYSIAVVDQTMCIQDVIFLDGRRKARSAPNGDALKGVSVIVMAGGKGTRLYPFTKILPKPLIPIMDVPILERIMNRFFEFGVMDFYLTVNYRKGMIKSYFSEILPSYHIHYIDEDEPLGTAGSIRLIKAIFAAPVIITNCDILIEADYEKILSYHMESGNDMTIVSSLKNTVIPYGVLNMGEKGIITSIQEKPQLSYFVNTGMYVLNPEFINWIPEHQVFHMTDLADSLMKRNRKVGMYPISEDSFLDMGQFEEMKKMEDRINNGYAE